MPLSFRKADPAPARGAPLDRDKGRVGVVGAVRAYVAHEDPAAAAANLIALLIASNGPFYPLYLLAVIGPAAMAPSLLTMVGAPFFLAIPWLSRRSSAAGRFAIVLVGTCHTLWCVKLLGPESGVGFFLLPCIALAALLFRPQERGLLLAAAALPFAAHLIPAALFGAPLMVTTQEEATALSALNLVSVAALGFVLALQFAALFARLERGPRP